MGDCAVGLSVRPGECKTSRRKSRMQELQVATGVRLEARPLCISQTGGFVGGVSRRCLEVLCPGENGSFDRAEYGLLDRYADFDQSLVFAV